MTHHGSCLCGEITFSTPGPLRPTIACHCRQCRKTSGHHVAATAAPKDSVTITGTPRWFNASPLARRGFCPTCGSQLFWDGPSTHLSIFAGALDTPVPPLAGHIFCASKAAYYDIPDDLPQADAEDPTLTTQVLD